MEAMTTNQVVPTEQSQKERQAKKLARKDVEAEKTFADVADEFVYKIKVPGWKNSQGIYSVPRYIFGPMVSRVFRNLCDLEQSLDTA